MVEPPRLSQWQTVSTRDSKSIPIRKNLSSRSECLLSGTTRAYGSENASAAASKLTPCFSALMAALRSSHSKSMYPFSIILTLYIHDTHLSDPIPRVREELGISPRTSEPDWIPADREHLLGYFCFHERGLIEEPKSYSDAWEREGTTASSERPDLIESISPRRPQP